MKPKRNTSNTPIDTGYLAQIVQDSGLTKREFSESVGRTEAFVHNALKRGYMQLPTAKLLCSLYDADLNKLLKQTEEPKEEKQEQQQMFCADGDIGNILKRIEAKLDELLSRNS